MPGGPELGVRVLVVDKDSLEVERRHELPPGFHFHHGNGWEEADGTIRLDLCQAPDPDFRHPASSAMSCGGRRGSARSIRSIGASRCCGRAAWRRMSMTGAGPPRTSRASTRAAPAGATT